jgi:hypothetical protein
MWKRAESIACEAQWIVRRGEDAKTATREGGRKHHARRWSHDRDTKAVEAAAIAAGKLRMIGMCHHKFNALSKHCPEGDLDLQTLVGHACPRSRLLWGGAHSVAASSRL